MSRDYIKLKVSDIRDILINEFGYDKNEVFDLKGKACLINLLKRNDKQEAGLDEINFEKVDSNSDIEKDNDNDEEGTEIIDQTSPLWNDYVMKQFVEDELFNKNPTVDGLRRIAEKLLGGIKSINSIVLQTPDLSNEKRCTVKVEILFFNDKMFAGVADSYWGNTDKKFRNYPSSIAETRAEGRALRKALGLRKVISAEELSETAEDDYGEEKVNITDTQIRFIEVMCESDRLNINVEKFIKSEGFICSKIQELKHDNSLLLQKKLSEYQQNIESIPEEIRGFSKSWRVSFT